VLAVAKFLPSYWFVRANDAISGLTVLSRDSLSPIFTGILIQLGFAAALFSVTLFMSRDRSASSV